MWICKNTEKQRIEYSIMKNLTPMRRMKLEDIIINKVDEIKMTYTAW